MALTKKRDGDRWRVFLNGSPTTILIEKGLPAKYGHTQMYDVVSDDADAYFFEAKGVAVAMSVLENLADALKGKVE